MKSSSSVHKFAGRLAVLILCAAVVAMAGFLLLRQHQRMAAERSVAMRDGKFDYRADVFINSRIIDIAPTEKAYQDRAHASLMLGDTEAALADWREARRLFPIAPTETAYYGRGYSYLLLGDTDAALADWREACRLGPSEWGPRSWMISVLLSRNHDDSAFQEIEDYLPHASDDSNIGVQIANMYVASKGHRRTDRLAEILMKKYPDDTRVYRSLSTSFWQEGTSESGARFAEAWLKRYPTDTDAFGDRIIFWYLLDRYDEVIRATDDVFKIEHQLNPSSISFYLSLQGTAYAKRGDYDRALSLHLRADRIDSTCNRFAGEGQWLAHLARGEIDSASFACLRPMVGWYQRSPESIRAAITLRLAGHDASADSVLRLAMKNPYLDSTNAVGVDFLLGEITESECFRRVADTHAISNAMAYAAVLRSWNGDRHGARRLLDSVVAHGDTMRVAFLAADLIVKRNLRPRPATPTPPWIDSAIAQILSGPLKTDTDYIADRLRDIGAATDDSSRIKAAYYLLSTLKNSIALDSFALVDNVWRDSMHNSPFDTDAENLRVNVAGIFYVRDRYDSAEELLNHVRIGGAEKQGADALWYANHILSHLAWRGTVEHYDRVRARWGSAVEEDFFEKSLIYFRREPALLMSFVVWLAAVSSGSILALMIFVRRRGVERALFPAMLAAGTLFVLQALLILSSDAIRENTSWLLTIAAVVRDLLVVVSGIALARAAGTGIFRRPGRGRALAVSALATTFCIIWTLFLLWIVPPRTSELMKWFETHQAGGELGVMISAQTLTLPLALLVVIAAIREEILCRGFFLPLIFLMIGGRRARMKATGAWWLASLSVGVLWALAHAGMVSPEWWKFLHVTGLALVLGEVTRRHGLLASAIVHGAFNVLIIILMSLQGRSF